MRRVRRVAIVDWTHLLEDYLDAIGVSLEAYLTEMTGGWLFGFVEALASADVETIVYVVSGRVCGTEVRRHCPTGARIRLLAAPRLYRAMRRAVWNPYGEVVEEAVTVRPGRRWLATSLWATAPYAATPLVGVARALREDRVDAVLCQEYEHPRFDLLVGLGRLLRLPVLGVYQGGDSPTTPGEPLTRSWAMRRCDGVVVGPSAEAERVRQRYGLAEGRIARLPNPLDVDLWASGSRDAGRKELGIPPHARVAVWHGRVLWRTKGLDVLLEAWARLGAEGGGERWLLLVGDGPDAGRLRAAIASGAPNVRWQDGYVNDRDVLVRWVSAGDVAVLPSRNEGFPVAPMEAMAAGLPVVASEVDAVRDLFPRGEVDGGVIVPQEDPARLAEALSRLLDEPGRSSSLGAAAVRRVQEAFSPSAVGRALAAVLEDVAGREGAPR